MLPEGASKTELTYVELLRVSGLSGSAMLVFLLAFLSLSGKVVKSSIHGLLLQYSYIRQCPRSVPKYFLQIGSFLLVLQLRPLHLHQLLPHGSHYRLGVTMERLSLMGYDFAMTYFLTL
jgi:hypothetical protein